MKSILKTICCNDEKLFQLLVSIPIFRYFCREFRFVLNRLCGLLLLICKNSSRLQRSINNNFRDK